MSGMAGLGATEDKAILVGGGFGALAAAVALDRVGVKSVVLERAPKMRQEGFAIGAFTNVWRALDELGAGDTVRHGHLSIQELELVNYNGNVLKRISIKDAPPPPHRPSHEVRAVQREAIPRALTNLVPPGTVQYGANVADVSTDDKGAVVELEGGRKLPCRFAVLADGVHSKTAAKLHKAELKYMNCAAWRGQVDLPCEELNTPRGMIVQGPNIRVGIIPMRYDAANKIASWFWFLAMQVNKKEELGSKEEQKQHMMQLIKDWKVDRVHQVLGQTPLDSFYFAHIYQRQVVGGRSWFDGCITGVGDSAHATTPFLAQGGAMALEDGVELGIAMMKAMQEAGCVPFTQLSPAAIAAALRYYEILRSHRVAAITSKSRMSMRFSLSQNFLVSMFVRFVAPYLIRPSFILGHTEWEPSGSLPPADSAKKAAAKQSFAEE